MDSLGRRVYGVDDRTFERELKTYFDSKFQDRASARSPNTRVSNNGSNGGIVDGGIKIMNNINTIARFLFTIFIFYMLYSVGRKLYEDMEQSMNEEEPEGDAFDKMFGSEFKGKFKNARQNKGVYKARQEEIRLKNLKEDNNTTSPVEVRKLVSHVDLQLMAILKAIVVCSQQDYLSCMYLKDLAKNSGSQNLFRVLYRGYTYRELLSPKVNKPELLREATDYVIQCVTTVG